MKGLVTGVALAMVVGGGTVSLIGGGDGTELVATFDDAQNLVAGHNVQLADVPVGRVSEVRLDGYKARVTVDIDEGIKIPRGTSAEIAVTSLLGENFVRLTPPAGKGLASGPYLEDGDIIRRTSQQPQFEQVVSQAGPLIEAIADNDVGTVVDAAATAFGGQGKRMNLLLNRSSHVLAMISAQRQELASSVDALARLGDDLAKGSSHLRDAPAELERTTDTLNRNKDKMLRAVRELTRMSRLLGDKVLEGRVVRIKTMIKKLDPVLLQLGGDRARFSKLISGLVEFVTKLPQATYDGQLLMFVQIAPMLPDGTKPLERLRKAGLPNLPDLPELPKLPEVPGLPDAPKPLDGWDDLLPGLGGSGSGSGSDSGSGSGSEEGGS